MEVLHVVGCRVRQERRVLGELVFDLKGDDGSIVRSLQWDQDSHEGGEVSGRCV